MRGWGRVWSRESAEHIIWCSSTRKEAERGGRKQHGMGACGSQGPDLGELPYAFRVRGQRFLGYSEDGRLLCLPPRVS